jgi:hypothetical protein
MTFGGDCLDTYQDVRSPAVGVIDTKLHLNSVISDAHLGACYCTGDLKDFFLVSDMPIYQYMQVHCRYVPQEIINKYNLTNQHFSSKGFVYLEIHKDMYGLKEAAMLAYNQLKAHLAPMDTFQLLKPLVSGAIRIAAQHLPLLLTTLASNSSLSLMLITSSMLLLLSMHLPEIGQDPATSGSPFPGIMLLAMLTFPCQTTFPKPSLLCVIPPRLVPNVDIKLS